MLERGEEKRSGSWSRGYNEKEECFPKIENISSGLYVGGNDPLIREEKNDDTRGKKKIIVGTKTLNRKQGKGSSVQEKSLAVMMTHCDG